MIHSLPHYSQHLDIRSKLWKHRACGIVSLKMVLEYWDPETSPTLPQLLARGKSMGAYIPGIGWKHKGIVAIAKQYNYDGRNYDWFSLPVRLAFKKTAALFKKYPIIISIHKNLNPKLSGHLIVAYKIKNGFIYYHDPDSLVRKKVAKKARITKFMKGWKRRIIVIYPKIFAQKQRK